MRKKTGFKKYCNIRSIRHWILSIFIKSKFIKNLLNYYENSVYFQNLEGKNLMHFSFDVFEKYGVKFSDKEARDIIKYNGNDAESAMITFTAREISNITVLGNSHAMISDEMVVTSLVKPSKVHRNWIKPAILKQVEGKGVYINLLGLIASHKHIYHFLFDYLTPLVIYLKKSGDKRNLKILVRDDLSKLQVNSFNFLKLEFPNIEIVKVKMRQKIHCEKLIYLDFLREPRLYLPEFVEYLKDLFVKNYGIVNGKKRRIFISRHDAKFRKMKNEDKVFAFLEKFGFERFALSKLTHKEQVELFHSAEIVVGTHGAGFTNLIFSDESVKILEMFPSVYRDEGYIRLAKILGIKNYHHLVFQAEKKNENFECDIGELEKVILELV